MSFTPQLSILPEAQLSLWDELDDVPDSFTLYGGTAIALYLGHRESVDFDFFSTEPFEPNELYNSISFLQGSEILQSAPSTLTCLVERGGYVQVSFFGLPAIKSVKSPHLLESPAIKIASLVDLAGMKASVVQQRAELKDYVDIAALIEQTDIDLPAALSAASKIYGAAFNPQSTLKALVFFEDGNLHNLSESVKSQLVQAVKTVDLDKLPTL
ncbi:nucleotidyl transferase AbiEii/AbiGii toxin family protein [Porticoccus sp. GXU_MW_L64]